MKLFKIILVTQLLSFSAFGQVEFGLKGGLNIANQKLTTGPISFTTKSIVGYHLGLFSSFDMGKSLSINPELCYNLVGQNQEINIGGSETFKTRYHYLNVPLLIQYKIIEMISVHAGPEFGVLLLAKIEDLKLGEFNKPFDLGLSIGIGLDLPFDLKFGLRYTQGLLNIFNDPDIASLDLDTSIKNRKFQFYIAYKLFSK